MALFEFYRCRNALRKAHTGKADGRTAFAEALRGVSGACAVSLISRALDMDSWDERPWGGLPLDAPLWDVLLWDDLLEPGRQWPGQHTPATAGLQRALSSLPECSTKPAPVTAGR